MSGDGWNAMPGQPRTWTGCGKRVRLDQSWLKTSEPKETWHTACRPKAKAR